MSIKEISELIKIATKPIISILSKGQNSKLIAVGLSKGTFLKEHKAPGPTRMIILEGKIEYKSAHRVEVFTSFDEFQIPLGELHAVTGLEESIFLLSVHN